MGLTIKDLEECFKTAKEKKIPFIAVKIEMDGLEKPEVIINPVENFENKLAYYKKAYNEDLTLRVFNGVRIIDFIYADNYLTIENAFM